VSALLVGCAAEALPEGDEAGYGIDDQGVGGVASPTDVALPLDVDHSNLTTLIGRPEVASERDPHPSPWHGGRAVEDTRDPHPSPWNPPKRDAKPSPGPNPEPGQGDTSAAESAKTSTK